MRHILSLWRQHRARSLAAVAALVAVAAVVVTAQPVGAAVIPSDAQTGTWWQGPAAVQISTTTIQQWQAQYEAKVAATGKPVPLSRKKEHEIPPKTRSNPNAPAVASYTNGEIALRAPEIQAPQNIGVGFLAATGGYLNTDSPYVPPDTMGAVGPTQYIISLNGRIRSFNKTNGAADGALNVDPDVFYQGLAVSGISDPQIRYDRLTQRWFNTAISTNTTPNYVVIAVSNGPTITVNTVWSFYKFRQDQVTPVGDTNCFFDYPTTGIDANALLIGGNQFCGANQTFAGSALFVVQKSSVLNAGSISVAAFRGLTGGYPNPGVNDIGITTPRGVDSWDVGLNYGYIVGDDNSRTGIVNFRKITYGGTPTLSANIEVTVPQTALPIPLDHTGNLNGPNGRIDGGDTRMMPAVMRDGYLYTSHNISTNASCVAQGATAGDRDAARWYKFGSLGTTPTLVLSGTICNTAATNPINYIYASMMVSGQGHVAFGMTQLNATTVINASTTGFLAGQTSAPTPIIIVNGNGSYNSFDVSGPARRWGDYTITTLDPCDDMTMWTAQEYAYEGNTPGNLNAKWGVHVRQLRAPGPAYPTGAAPSSVPQGRANVNITITGVSSGGSGYYDTPATMSGEPCRKRLAVSVSNGVVVNNVTFNTPTSITVNVSTYGASTGTALVTITNPDGQSINNAILNITAGTATGSPTTTPSPTQTATATRTPTVTATLTPSNTPSATLTLTPSNTATNTVVPPASPTLTLTPSLTPTATPPPVTVCPGTHTANSPKFHRTLAGNPPAGLSSVGTNTPYRAQTFSVTLTGSYTMEMLSANFSGTAVADDGFYALYQGSFNPSNALANILEANDDKDGTTYRPSITRTLTAGITYVLVSTSYDNNVTGSFVDNISGPGFTIGWCPQLNPSPTPTSTTVPPQGDTIGVYKNGVFYLRNSNSTGPADIIATFGGDASDLPVAGDWNGDTVSTIGVYRSNVGTFLLSDSNLAPAVNYQFTFGNPGDTPFAGKWTNGATKDGVGVYRNSNGILYLKNALSTGFSDFFMIFGNPGDTGFAGDWDNDGVDSVGIYRPSTQRFYLTNVNGNGITFSNIDFAWSIGSALPVAGDWNNDGVSTLGIFDPSLGTFSLNNSNAAPGSLNTFSFGPTSGKPISGKWGSTSAPFSILQVKPPVIKATSESAGFE